ncbi:enoyl-CoA hydratase-related protein [Thalassobacillus hwangdonensis]|uniref:Enoyl-CoA hydratase-related protein n=1 Tax=Thalassobacillus hwangdonensis TaxID=546108 RepID=A0ABW3L128_9BACI
MFETISYDVHNHVAWIKMNRPDKLNAFTAAMNHEVAKAVKQATKDEEVRCLVITGEGRAFCSGQDLSSVDEGTDYGDVLRDNYGPMVRAIDACEKPIIAALNGVTAGAGLSLALACDFRLAKEDVKLIQAFIHVGLIPDAGNMYYLPKLIGHAKALELAVLGEKVSAAEAKELGLLTKVVSADEFDEEVNAFAARLAAMPTKAIGLIKRSLKAGWNEDFDTYLEREAQGQRIAGMTEDHREGVGAFMEKRKPQFTGK